VLREAIGRLQSIGVLRVVHGRGTFVADRAALMGCVQLVRTVLRISSMELIQFMELRTAIECQAARLAAQRASPQAVAQLEESYRHARAKGLDVNEGMRRDLKFHLKIVELGGNKLMVDVMQVIQELTIEAMARTLPKPQERRWAEALHMAIVDAIRSGDPDAAEAAARHHMEELCQRLSGARATLSKVTKTG
jgi:DNA-binding FadR family transcriptional regulator